MTRIGLWGARADGGGLAAMTQEFWRHVRPDRTMVVDLGDAGRGPARHFRYPASDIVFGMNEAITPTACRRFLDGLDVVYAAETWYRDDFCDIARDMNVRTVLHAMPELYRADQASATAVWVPTTWETARIPRDVTVMPVPVARDRLPRRPLRRPAVTFLHVGAPAFHDRNGRQLLTQALPFIRSEINLIVTGPEPVDEGFRPSNVTIDHRPVGKVNYWDTYTADVDALILPRRYAGLSLPMQEAASLGLPIITLDLAPQNRWVHPATLIPAQVHHQARMVAGKFDVYTCAPQALAATIDLIATDPDVAAAASTWSDEYANLLSWDAWTAQYLTALADTATKEP